MQNLDVASRGLKGSRNRLFVEFTDRPDDLQTKSFVKADASSEIPTGDAHMLKIFDHSFSCFVMPIR
jgi:hypothetical protein